MYRPRVDVLLWNRETELMEVIELRSDIRRAATPPQINYIT